MTESYLDHVMQAGMRSFVVYDITSVGGEPLNWK